MIITVNTIQKLANVPSAFSNMHIEDHYDIVPSGKTRNISKVRLFKNYTNELI